MSVELNRAKTLISLKKSIVKTLFFNFFILFIYFKKKKIKPLLFEKQMFIDLSLNTFCQYTVLNFSFLITI